MPLEIEITRVREVRPGTETRVDADGILHLDSSALADSLRASDPRIPGVAIDFVASGQSVRIVCVKDVIEPRACREDGPLRALKDLAVVTCGPIVGFQEGIIDMAGPGAEFHPFGGCHLVVLRLERDPALTPHEYEEVVRLAGLHAAEFLARHAIDGPADETRTIEVAPPPSEASLPRFAYVYMVLSQGLLHDTWVEGINARDPEFVPRLIDPEAIFRSGVVSGNCVSACDKNTTWHHQNNAVLDELIRGHGDRWDFAGIVLTNAPTSLGGKQASAERAVALARELEADGAVISKEGFGNPDADLMMLIHGLEQAGVKTVAITDEFAGNDGGSPSLADATPEADALVSTGNANARIVLPPLENVIGPIGDVPQLTGSSQSCLKPDGSLDLEIQALIGATNQLGQGRLRCHEI